MLYESPATLAKLARRFYESRGHSKRRTEAPQAPQRGQIITVIRRPQVKEWYFSLTPARVCSNDCPQTLKRQSSLFYSSIPRKILVEIPIACNKDPFFLQVCGHLVQGKVSVGHREQYLTAVCVLRTVALNFLYCGFAPHAATTPPSAVSGNRFGASVPRCG